MAGEGELFISGETNIPEMITTVIGALERLTTHSGGGGDFGGDILARLRQMQSELGKFDTQLKSVREKMETAGGRYEATKGAATGTPEAAINSGAAAQLTTASQQLETVFSGLTHTLGEFYSTASSIIPEQAAGAQRVLVEAVRAMFDQVAATAHEAGQRSFGGGGRRDGDEFSGSPDEVFRFTDHLHMAAEHFARVLGESADAFARKVHDAAATSGGSSGSGGSTPGPTPAPDMAPLELLNGTNVELTSAVRLLIAELTTLSAQMATAAAGGKGGGTGGGHGGHGGHGGGGQGGGTGGGGPQPHGPDEDEPWSTWASGNSQDRRKAQEAWRRATEIPTQELYERARNRNDPDVYFAGTEPGRGHIPPSENSPILRRNASGEDWVYNAVPRIPDTPNAMSFARDPGQQREVPRERQYTAERQAAQQQAAAALEARRMARELQALTPGVLHDPATGDIFSARTGRLTGNAVLDPATGRYEGVAGPRTGTASENRTDQATLTRGVEELRKLADRSATSEARADVMRRGQAGGDLTPLSATTFHNPVTGEILSSATGRAVGTAQVDPATRAVTGSQEAAAGARTAEQIAADVKELTAALRALETAARRAAKEATAAAGSAAKVDVQRRINAGELKQVGATAVYRDPATGQAFSANSGREVGTVHHDPPGGPPLSQVAPDGTRTADQVAADFKEFNAALEAMRKTAEQMAQEAVQAAQEAARNDVFSRGGAAGGARELNRVGATSTYHDPATGELFSSTSGRKIGASRTDAAGTVSVEPVQDSSRTLEQTNADLKELLAALTVLEREAKATAEQAQKDAIEATRQSQMAEVNAGRRVPIGSARQTLFTTAPGGGDVLNLRTGKPIETASEQYEFDALAAVQRKQQEAQAKTRAKAAQGDPGFGQAFVGGLTGTGFHAPGTGLVSLAGTAGVLARYSAAGAAVSTLFKAFDQVKEAVLSTDLAFAQFDEAVKTVGGGTVDTSKAFADMAAYGMDGVTALQVGAHALQMFRVEIEAGANKTDIFNESIKDAGIFALATGQDAETAGKQLAQMALDFGGGSGMQAQLSDATVSASKNYGVDRKQLAIATAGASNVANVAGVNPEELTNLLAAGMQGSGISGTQASSQLTGLLARSEKGPFQALRNKLNVADSGNFAQEIVAMGAAFNGLSAAQQKVDLASVSSGRSMGFLQSLLRNAVSLNDNVTRSLDDQGAAADAAAVKQHTIGQQLRDLGAAFKDLAQNFADSGILIPLGLILAALGPMVGALNSVYQLFKKVGDLLPITGKQFSAVTGGILDAWLALKLYTTLMAAGGLAPALGALARVGRRSKPGEDAAGTTATGAAPVAAGRGSRGASAAGEDEAVVARRRGGRLNPLQGAPTRAAMRDAARLDRVETAYASEDADIAERQGPRLYRRVGVQAADAEATLAANQELGRHRTWVSGQRAAFDESATATRAGVGTGAGMLARQEQAEVEIAARRAAMEAEIAERAKASQAVAKTMLAGGEEGAAAIRAAAESVAAAEEAAAAKVAAGGTVIEEAEVASGAKAAVGGMAGGARMTGFGGLGMMVGIMGAAYAGEKIHENAAKLESATTHGVDVLGTDMGSDPAAYGANATGAAKDLHNQRNEFWNKYWTEPITTGLGALFGGSADAGLTPKAEEDQLNDRAGIASETAKNLEAARAEQGLATSSNAAYVNMANLADSFNTLRARGLSVTASMQAINEAFANFVHNKDAGTAGGSQRYLADGQAGQVAAAAAGDIITAAKGIGKQPLDPDHRPDDRGHLPGQPKPPPRPLVPNQEFNDLFKGKDDKKLTDSVNASLQDYMKTHQGKVDRKELAGVALEAEKQALGITPEQWAKLKPETQQQLRIAAAGGSARALNDVTGTELQTSDTYIAHMKQVQDAAAGIQKEASTTASLSGDSRGGSLAGVQAARKTLTDEEKTAQDALDADAKLPADDKNKMTPDQRKALEDQKKSIEDQDKELQIQEQQAKEQHEDNLGQAKESRISQYNKSGRADVAVETAKTEYDMATDADDKAQKEAKLNAAKQAQAAQKLADENAATLADATPGDQVSQTQAQLKAAQHTLETLKAQGAKGEDLSNAEKAVKEARHAAAYATIEQATAEALALTDMRDTAGRDAIALADAQKHLDQATKEGNQTDIAKYTQQHADALVTSQQHADEGTAAAALARIDPRDTLANAQAHLDDINRKLARYTSANLGNTTGAQQLVRQQVEAQQAVTEKRDAVTLSGQRAGTDPLDTVGEASLNLATAQATLNRLIPSDERYGAAVQAVTAAKRDYAKAQADVALSALRATTDPRDTLAQAQLALAAARTALAGLIPSNAGYGAALAAVHSAELDVAKAAADMVVSNVVAGTLSEGGLGQASIALAQAKANFDLATAKSADFGQKVAAYFASQLAYANAMDAASATAAGLHQDLTDPTTVAHNATTAAQNKLAELKKAIAAQRAYDKAHNIKFDEAAAQDAINSGQTDVNAAVNAEQKATFDKQLQDTQQAYSLHQTSGAAYIAALRKQRDGIVDVNYQTHQEIYQLNKAIQDANEQMSGQFNLSDIKLPSVYEVRRAVASSTQAIDGSSATTNNNVIINGADFAKVIAYIKSILTPAAGRVVTPRR